MRLTLISAESVSIGNIRFLKGEWTEVPDDRLWYFLSEGCPYILREERCLGLYHIRYTGDAPQAFELEDDTGRRTFDVHPGEDYAVKRHEASKLLRRRDFVHTPPADVLPYCDRVVVIRHGGLGDVLLSMPAVRKLKAAYPELTVDYATSDIFADVPRRVAGCETVWDVAEVYEQTGYDAVFDLRVLVESAEDSASVHRADIFARRLGLTLDSYATPYVVTDAEREDVRGMVGDAARPLIGVQTAGSIGRRTPSVGRMLEIVAALMACGYTCMMLDHRPDDQWEGTVNLTGKLSVPQLFAALAECDVVLAGDSGVLHAANAVGVPTVGTFGSVDARLRVRDQPNCLTIQCNEWSGCAVCNDHQFQRCAAPEFCQDAVPTDVVVSAVTSLIR